MGGISFPLKWKIISSNIILLFMTVFLIIRFATDLFNQDKAATLYEATLNAGNSFKEQVAGAIKENKRSLLLLSEVVQNQSLAKMEKKALLKSIFEKNDRLVSFSAWERESAQLVVYLENDIYRNQNKNVKEKWLSEDREIWQNDHRRFARQGEGGSFLYREQERDKKFVFIGRYQLEGLVKAKDEGLRYHSFVLFNNDVLAAPQTWQNFKKDRKSFISQAQRLQEEWRQGSREKVDRKVFGDKAFLTHSAALLPGLGVVTLVDEGLIYQASSFLREQSLYFGGLIFGVTILMGIFLSRRMTKNLASLHQASLAYARGQFDSKWEVKGNDEIGSLAKTFKKMGHDILDYIEKMKDKARLEKEVEVAKLVQESFIPTENFDFGAYSLHSYYEPASECGGDWWGVITRGPWVSLVVADATGHGVPAALLTATGSGCLHNMELRLEEEEREYFLPSTILKNINYSMARMASKIHMTAFALVFNSNTGEAFYSNASHNPPLLLRDAFTGDFDKSRVEPLMEKIGSRLGENIASEYVDNPLVLNRHDLLVLFSDGIIEEMNEEGKEFGQRRFLKVLVEYAQEDLIKKGMTPLAENVLSRLREFTGRTQWSDDLTFITLGQENKEIVFYDKETAVVGALGNAKAYGELLAQRPLSTIVGNLDDLVEVQFLKENGLTFANLGFESKGERFIEGTDQSENIIPSLLEPLEVTGYFKGLLEPLQLVLKELISNALYHQSTETTSLERRGGITVEGKGVLVSIGQGGDGLGVIVEDRAGRLTYDILRNAIVRAYQDRGPEWKEGGAGLGLLMLLENSNKVFIMREAGQYTRICAIIEKERRYKNFKNKTTKFSYWES